MPRSLFRPAPARRGFTLIELMLALAIVGLIVALALPELQGAALRARQAEREVMMASIIQAVNTYASAHEGLLPGGELPDLPRNPDHAPDGSRRPFRAGLGRWADLGWASEGPVYFRYDVTCPSPGTVVVTAQADLDGNGQVNVKARTYKLQDGLFLLAAETESKDPY